MHYVNNYAESEQLRHIDFFGRLVVGSCGEDFVIDLAEAAGGPVEREDIFQRRADLDGMGPGRGARWGKTTSRRSKPVCHPSRRHLWHGMEAWSHRARARPCHCDETPPVDKSG